MLGWEEQRERVLSRLYKPEAGLKPMTLRYDWSKNQELDAYLHHPGTPF